MFTEPAGSYDELPYTNNCFPETNPDYLATLAGLYGLAPPVERCRVLELGCGGGVNLITMALELPEARFVGIDLSPRQVEEGREFIAALGLENIQLDAKSIMDVDASLGAFDYIVCHGVYSWVPEAVREKILAICSERLARGGVAYVSYNTYPGWHSRGIVRELLTYHVRRPTSALDRVERARAFLDDLVRVIPNKGSSYARVLRTETDLLQGVTNTYLYHEHLEETNHPLYFHEFMDRAAAKGLRFVAEARSPGLIDSLPADARESLDAWAEDDPIAAEQYLDYLCNRTFRRTILCHADQAISRTAATHTIHTLSVATNVGPASETPDGTSDRAEEFRGREGGPGLTTNNPVIKSALLALYRVKPLYLPFEELLAEVERQVEGVESRATLEGALLKCFLANLVELSTRHPRFAFAPGSHPRGSPLARLQAATSPRVTSLRRRTVSLVDFDQTLLGLLDGTRDHEALITAMMLKVEANEFTISQQGERVRDPGLISEIVRAEIQNSLERLVGMALLAADE